MTSKTLTAGSEDVRMAENKRACPLEEESEVESQWSRVEEVENDLMEVKGRLTNMEALMTKIHETLVAQAHMK